MDKNTKGLLEPKENTAIGGTQAVARAASLMRQIAAGGMSGSSLVELASRSMLERPTAYRILQRLVAEGLVEQDPASRSYELGPLLYELALAAKPPRLLFSQASAISAHLARESGDTVFAIIQSGLDSVCIDRKEGSYPVKATMMDPGHRRPMGIGSGSLALLAAMPEAKADQILNTNMTRIAREIDDRGHALRGIIKQGQMDGYILRAATAAPEILSLAIAVRNSYGTPLLALSISALQFRIEHRFDFLLGLLNESRQELESTLRASQLKQKA